MISPMEPHWKWCLTLLVVVVSAHTDTKVTSSQHMDDFIRVLEQVEDSNPGLEPIAVLRGLRRAAGLRDEFMQHFLGTIWEDSTSEAPVMDSNLSDFIGRAMRHKVTERGIEEGVVLTADGTTVAMSPVLLGIEAGLVSKTRCRVRGLYPLTLARNLGLSFQRFHSSLLSQRLGPDGCWDDVTSPQVFALSDKPSLATDALVNGGMDGVILGMEVSAQSQRPLKLSSLLRRYYCHCLEGEGLDIAARLISRLRREKFRELARPPPAEAGGEIPGPTEETDRPLYDVGTGKGRADSCGEGRNKRVCPQIHGLSSHYPAVSVGGCTIPGHSHPPVPPLSFMYIHHTYQPGQPCLTFQQCSADMRSMQRFHQDDRGWDDIGYSFVAGSDGYLYEGRGWHWQGAHTKGYNSKGYGVSFIGDYTSSLPSQQTMKLVRDRLASCAVGGRRLVGNFTLYGHRQLVNTSCPGDAFYSEITGWEHFGEVQN